MIIGVNLPNYSSLGNRDSLTAIAQAAEALGYASLWTSDHVLLPTSLPEPFGHLLESLTTLVIEPASTDLDDFLRQLTRFADEVTPHITVAPSLPSDRATVGSVDARV